MAANVLSQIFYLKFLFIRQPESIYDWIKCSFFLSYLSTDTSIVFVFSFYICSWLSNKPPQEIINNSISLLLSFVCHFLKNNQRFLHFCFEKCFLNWLIPINSLRPTKYRKSINPDMLFGCRLSNVHFAPTWIIWDYRPSATGICTVSGQFFIHNLKMGESKHLKWPEKV